MTCPHGYDDGAYVLGALCPKERSRYESHLAECAICRTAVAELAVLPGLLGRVDAADLAEAAPAPEPERLPQLIAAVTQSRRRRSRVRGMQFATVMIAAAALAIAASAALLGEPPPVPPPPPQQPQLTAMRPVTETAVSAEVAMAPADTGTRLWMQCRYDESGAPDPHTFRLVAVGTDGSREEVASWTAAIGDEVSLVGVTHYPRYELLRLELRGYGSDRLLLTFEPS